MPGLLCSNFSGKWSKNSLELNQNVSKYALDCRIPSDGQDSNGNGGSSSSSDTK